MAAHLSAIRSLYRWAALDGLIDTDPAGALLSPRKTKTLPRTLDTTQIELLLAAPDPLKAEGVRDAAMLELLYASGARISEVAGLSVDAVDFPDRSVRLFGKGRKERIVPCTVAPWMPSGSISTGREASFSRDPAWRRRRYSSPDGEGPWTPRRSDTGSKSSLRRAGFRLTRRPTR